MKLSPQEESLRSVIQAVQSKKEIRKRAIVTFSSIALITGFFVMSYSQEQSSPKEVITTAIDEPEVIFDPISDEDFLKLLKEKKGALITYADGSQKVLLPPESGD